MPTTTTTVDPWVMRLWAQLQWALDLTPDQESATAIQRTLMPAGDFSHLLTVELHEGQSRITWRPWAELVLLNLRDALTDASRSLQKRRSDIWLALRVLEPKP